ncbi:MAG: hypothetical protein A3K04_03285 [Gallionellales bacterium RBG_16_56_9]|nr:MAG: hypothetical protein A3K04_03285 [Gallionellales bacterium RBG_16_56_9]
MLAGAALPAFFLTAPDLPCTLWIGVGLVFAVSLLEDIHGVAVVCRLAVHVLAAAIFAVSFFWADFGIAIAIVATLFIVWMTNLFNFMDGSDGLAGGMAVIGFSIYGVAAWLTGSTDFALLNFSIAAAGSAFLLDNFHPARVFMGDSGAISLGFLVAVLGLIGWRNGDWELWFPLLVFSPFFVDASITLARRIVAREIFWEPHCDHYYQRLVLLGWGHRGTALAEYGLMLACGGLALVARSASLEIQVFVLCVIALLYATLIAAVHRSWHKSIRSKQSNNARPAASGRHDTPLSGQ